MRQRGGLRTVTRRIHRLCRVATWQTAFRCRPVRSRPSAKRRASVKSPDATTKPPTAFGGTSRRTVRAPWLPRRCARVPSIAVLHEIGVAPEPKRWSTPLSGRCHRAVRLKKPRCRNICRQAVRTAPGHGFQCGTTAKAADRCMQTPGAPRAARRSRPQQKARARHACKITAKVRHSSGRRKRPCFFMVGWRDVGLYREIVEPGMSQGCQQHTATTRAGEPRARSDPQKTASFAAMPAFSTVTVVIGGHYAKEIRGSRLHLTPGGGWHSERGKSLF